MCGIAGFCNMPDRWQENIRRMNERIVHRGPDGEGIWSNYDNSVVFGHRRLAVIDLSENGKQPMSSKTGRTVITYNGEIYNIAELREKLCREGVITKFRGHSDTEVLLESIEAYGIYDTLKMSKGMFALAVYDCESKILYLARDRMGEKPLYYGFIRNNFVFSSDIAAIRSNLFFDAEIDRDALALYFRGGYIPAPYSIYKNIYKLDAGCVLEISAPYNEIRVNKYWDIMKVARDGEENLLQGDEQDLTDRLEKLIKDSVKAQMVADVSVGSFLSGGIDSSTISAVMQSLSTKPIKTFTIGFKVKGYDEAENANRIARFLGTDHSELYVTEKEAMEVIPQIPYIYGEPYADDSELATVIVSRLAKEKVTVCLSGDGGDELFCGYNSYNRNEELWSKISAIPKLARAFGSASLELFNSKYNNKYHRYAHYMKARSIENLYELHGSLVPMTDAIVKDSRIPSYKYNTYPQGYLNCGKANIMLMDMLVYLPDDILTKVDRAGMSVSLESRIPLLDKDIVEFSWKIPMAYKNDGTTTKKILKNVLYRYVPKEMVERPKKGFSVPVGEWCRNGELKEWASDLLSSDKIKREGYLNNKAVQILRRDFDKTGENSNMIWKICMFENWLDENMK